MQLHQVDIVYLKHDLDPLKSPHDRKKVNCIVLQVESLCSFIIMGLKQVGRAQKEQKDLLFFFLMFKPSSP